MRINTLCIGKFAKEFVSLALIAGSMWAITPTTIVHAKSSSSETDSKSSEKSESKSSEKEEKQSEGDIEDKSTRSAADDEEDVDKSGASDEESDADKEEKSEDETTSSKETPSALTPEKLPEKLSGILSSVSKSSDWGVKVVIAETGETLFESKSDEGFIPASNRKLFTGALALDQLGPDYTFRTYLYHTGTVDANGTLNGNLVIIPSGDPTFSKTLYKASHPDWVFRDWADKVKAAGIKYIKGDLLVDCSGWDMNDMTPYGWPSRVINDSYAPQTSPLTINENLTNIVLTPGDSGQPASVSFIPSATGYPTVNKTESGKKGSPIAKRIVNSHIELRGGVSAKRTIWSFPIDRPTLYAAANFRHHLMENEVPIEGSVRLHTLAGVLPAANSTNTIAMVQSPPLIEIVDYMMKRSDNHMAEQLYVAISNAKLGRGSYGNSRRLEADLLTRAGVDVRNIHCYDGSGLSEANRVSPTDVCKLLTFMRGHRFAQQYYDSMAVSGREGTLRSRMGSISGRVHAKTGTINGVKTLSGYLTLSSDKTLSFSFLVNEIKGGSVSGVQDRLCTTLAMLVL